jgi:hypothetical protein
MKENVGSLDRAVRFVAGPALMALALTRWGAREGRPRGLLLLTVGALVTQDAITKVCPVNGLLGRDTRRAEERELEETTLAWWSVEPPAAL